MGSKTDIPISSFAAVASALALGACGGFGSFSFTEESDEIVVEGGDLTGELGDLFPAEIPMTVNLQQQLEEQNASGARAVHLTELEFRMTDDTDEDDFGFMNSIEIDVDAEGQSRELLAWRDEVPADGSFSLDTDDGLDLKPYVEAGVDLITEVEGSQPSQDAHFKVYATFDVDVL